MNLDNGALRVNGVKDIKAVSDYLINTGISKKEALGIAGGSYGGYAKPEPLLRVADSRY
ncbi:MAG: prolyl oligopeptidase family serine peptidase [Bacteroidota bacterium]